MNEKDYGFERVVAEMKKDVLKESRLGLVADQVCVRIDRAARKFREAVGLDPAASGVDAPAKTTDEGPVPKPPKSKTPAE